MRRCLAVLVIALAVMSVSASAGAAIYDPASNWRTLESPHFKIHYPENISQIAERSAVILEEFYPKAVEAWGWKPLGRTQVVLLDNTDLSNGLASVLPYNFLIIYVAPPPPGSSLAHYDDWLRMLLVHEFTHIVQIDAVGGAWRPLRFIFGKTAAPSGMNPVWLREGIAQYVETYYTDGGRGRGYYSEMMVRMSVLDDVFPTIDQADGLGWRWPGYRGAYVYGLKFTQWLVSEYGEERFMELDRRIRSNLLLGMLNHHARNIYGKTFYELWNEWRQQLLISYRAQRADIEAEGLTPPERIVAAIDRNQEYSIPAISNDGRYLAYQEDSPHYKPRVMFMDLASGDRSIIKRGHKATQFSFSPDGSKLVYSTITSSRRFYRYYDLWMYDFDAESRKKRLKRLTVGARARDPEFDHSGRSIIFVEGGQGTDKLKVLDIETKETREITPDVPSYTQFAGPRLSPDGRHLAVSVWKPGQGWRVWLYTADGRPVRRLTRSEGLVIESRPAWSADGGWIVFSSDEGGVANLHRVRPDGTGLARTTNVLSGVFQPAPAPDGGVYAQYYTSKGFVIALFPPEAGKYPVVEKGRYRLAEFWDAEAAGSPEKGRLRTTVTTHDRTGSVTRSDFRSRDGVKHDALPPAEELSLSDRKYVAWGAPLFLPRFLIPAAAYVDDTLFVSAFTGGSDPLRWHNWLAGVSYRLDANHVGYYGRYWYNRYRPIFGLSVRDYAVDFGQIVFVSGDDRRQVHYYEHRRSASGFVALPVGRQVFTLSYFYEDHMPKTRLTQPEKDALNLGIFAGFTFNYNYKDWERNPASISNENGRAIRLSTTVTNKHLGSGDRNEQVIFSGDWREYVSLYRHHVLALRAAGGMTWGDRLVQGTFGLGGAVGEGPLASGGAYTYFPLRGLPISALSRTRAMIFSAEYRFPIVSPLRGLGTTPFFVRDISGAVFVDYGNAWNAHEAGSDSIKTFFDEFLMGVGVELRGDFVLGHGLPIHGRLGYGIIVLNRDRVSRLKDPLLGTGIDYGTLILTLGFSF